MDESTQYIKNQLAAGVLPTQIVQNLVQAGWQEPQAIVAVQQVSGVQLAVAAGPGGYTKPPIILQILYGLSFIALFFGILLVGFGFMILRSNSSEFAGTIASFQVLLGLYFLSVFWLFRKMRNGSLFALKIYSGLTLFGIILTAATYFYVSNKPILSAGILPTEIADIFTQNILPILITVYLWTRHRAYFR